jgi:hypothetical protein
MEIFVNYIIPNIILFGGIFVFAKGIEYASWYLICNYDTIVGKLINGKY